MNKNECVILGLTLNGLHVLEMAAEGNRRIQIEGDVDLEVKQLRPHSNR